jgi:hypothetical protein
MATGTASASAEEARGGVIKKRSLKVLPIKRKLAKKL